MAKSPLTIDVNVRVTTHRQFIWRVWQISQHQAVARGTTPGGEFECFVSGQSDLVPVVDSARA